MIARKWITHTRDSKDSTVYTLEAADSTLIRIYLIRS
jgi:hypothetical protein